MNVTDATDQGIGPEIVQTIDIMGLEDQVEGQGHPKEEGQGHAQGQRNADHAVGAMKGGEEAVEGQSLEAEA